MRLSVFHLSAVQLVMPVVSGQAADPLTNQPISHGAVELTPMPPRICGLRFNPMLQFLIIQSGLADEESAVNHNSGWSSSLRNPEDLASGH